MLLKPRPPPVPPPVPACFSTLYRVDAIEARTRRHGMSMLPSFSTLYRVDAIEAATPWRCGSTRRRFSTLYRVDAIEARRWQHRNLVPHQFQYPLSGRCY